MNLISIILISITFQTTNVFAALQNSTREFKLKTVLKPGQVDKSRYDNLWLVPYHTAAGFNDAVLIKNPEYAANGFLNGSVGFQGAYHKMVFDLGTDFPYFMDMQINTNFYAAWEPVGVDVSTEGGVPGGFWINGTGLQWTTVPSQPPDYKFNQFGGWLVCDWWHGSPQLFFRVNSWDTTVPCSCADVYLVPEYCEGT